MPGTAAGTWRLRQRTVAVATCSGVACVGALLARDHHVGLEDHAFEMDAVPLELREHLGQHVASRDLLAALDRMRAIHQYLGLDDRHDVLFLAERRVARQRLGIGLDRKARRECRRRC